MSDQVDVNAAASEHHVFPIQAYLAVFGALLVLTVVTVGVSYMNLGPASLYVALVVAFIKAGLVVGFFMHLRYDSRFHQLIFFSSAIFILIMFGFTFIDLASRSDAVVEQGTFAMRKEQSNARRSAELAAKQKATQAALEAAKKQAPASAAGAGATAAPSPEAAPAAQGAGAAAPATP